jgi:hypothetical protein
MMQVPFDALTQLVMPRAITTGLFDSTVTIQQPDGNYGPTGAPSGTYTNVIGLVGILAMDAPPSVARVQATEVKALAEIMAKQLRHVLLNGYFPQIAAGVATGWRAIVTRTSTGAPITYDILGAEVDSQSTQTRLELQLVGV